MLLRQDIHVALTTKAVLRDVKDGDEERKELSLSVQARAPIGPGSERTSGFTFEGELPEALRAEVQAVLEKVEAAVSDQLAKQAVVKAQNDGNVHLRMGGTL